MTVFEDLVDRIDTLIMTRIGDCLTHKMTTAPAQAKQSLVAAIEAIHDSMPQPLRTTSSDLAVAAAKAAKTQTERQRSYFDVNTQP